MSMPLSLKTAKEDEISASVELAERLSIAACLMSSMILIFIAASLS